LFYDSPRWSGVFLLGIFAVSVWNGGGYYIEVFGRKFERELEALRKELAESNARSGRSSPTSGMSDGAELSSSPGGSPVLKSTTLTSARTGRPFSPKMPSIDLALGESVMPATNGEVAAERKKDQ
jgi:hypothetical protein